MYTVYIYIYIQYMYVTVYIYIYIYIIQKTYSQPNPLKSGASRVRSELEL